MINFLAIAIGIVALIWGSDRFVAGAAATARNLSMPPLLIGLTVVSLGTSAPEILVSVTAAANGNTGLAIGNVIGSNITNIALVLGITALAAPLLVKSALLRSELPMLLIVTIISAALLFDGHLSRSDGVILLGMQIAVMFLLMRWTMKRSKAGADGLLVESDEDIPSDWSTGKALLWLAIGLFVLLVGSRMVVWAAVNIAEGFGVSELVIGLTIVALGTSLPELGASVTSALKGQHDIALGNILGSNLFNLLIVMGSAGVVGPAVVESIAISRDLPVMLGLTLLLVILAMSWRGRPARISRFDGGLFLAAFVAYECLLFYSVVQAQA